MGIRLLQRKNCGDQILYQQLSDKLAKMIEGQLTWDPRVGDVYIQRALMLIESGHKNKVKNAWIQNILNEQRENGGWASFYKLFTFNDSTEIGFNYKLPGICTNPKANFHTTAQAIYLLSLIS